MSLGHDLRTALTALLPRLRRFGISLTGSSAAADILVRNACERVLRRSSQARNATRTDALVYGIMRDLWADEQRDRGPLRPNDAAVATAIAGKDGGDRRITLAAVRQALATLPAEHRTVLVLVCVDGLSYQEAAEVMGVPVDTVRTRLSRGRQDLHAILYGRTSADTVTPFPLNPGRGRA